MHPKPNTPSESSVWTARDTTKSGSHQWYGITGLLCLVLGIGTAVMVGLVTGNTRDRRLDTCDGTILLPVWGLIAGWASAIIGLIAVALCVVAFVKRRHPRMAFWPVWHEIFIGVLLPLSVFGLLFDLLFLRGAYDYTVPIYNLCSG
jgi:hypothetical protein